MAYLRINLHRYSARSAGLVSGKRFQNKRMRSAAKILVRVIAFCTIATSLFITRATRAQENGATEAGVARTADFEMIVRAGFGRLEVSTWTGSWVPFRISISNQGPPILGRLIVHCESSANPTPQVREYVDRK